MRCVNTEPIICKPTLDTFVRLAVVWAAFLGFGLYFFYDGAVGYRRANEVFLSRKAFAALGQEATGLTREEWQRRYRADTPLLRTEGSGRALTGLQEGGAPLPLPPACAAAGAMPPEALDYEAMRRSWNDCWVAYTERRHFPVKPAEHGYDQGAIREQWIAGVLCTAVSLLLIGLALRTRRRVLALEGDCVTAAGQQFRVQDITRLDLRQWGPGFKGVAYATVQGRRIRLDGMTYGGFAESKGAPAERWMQALLARYEGEILEYEQPDAH